MLEGAHVSSRERKTVGEVELRGRARAQFRHVTLEMTISYLSRDVRCAAGYVVLEFRGENWPRDRNSGGVSS